MFQLYETKLLLTLVAEITPHHFLRCLFLDKIWNLNSNDASLSFWPISTLLTLHWFDSSHYNSSEKNNTTHLPPLQAKSVFLGYLHTRYTRVWQFNECPDTEITFPPSIRAFIKLSNSTFFTEIFSERKLMTSMLTQTLIIEYCLTGSLSPLKPD